MADEIQEFQIFIADAFTSKPLSGNPAAVCLVGNWVSVYIIWVMGPAHSTFTFTFDLF